MLGRIDRGCMSGAGEGLTGTKKESLQWRNLRFIVPAGGNQDKKKVQVETLT
jgi:hypothetical protein